MVDLSPPALKRAYGRLFGEYEAFNKNTCPAKLSLDVARPGSGLGVFGNAMAARLSDGHFGGKFITVNEDNAGKMSALIAVFAPTGQLLRSLDGVHLTRLRCGMMAVQAAHRFFGADALSGLRYGFVGSGQINAQTARVLGEVFGVPGEALFLLGSRRNPRKIWASIRMGPRWCCQRVNWRTVMLFSSAARFRSEKRCWRLRI